MKNKRFFIVLMVMQLALLHSVKIFAQSNGDYRSKASGNWSDTSSWQTYVSASNTWARALVAPSGPRSVYIMNGDTITLNTNGACNKLTVNSGAVLTTASALSLTVRGTILNQGIITSTGSDGIILSINNTVDTMSVYGAGGTCTLGRIRALGNNPHHLNLKIKQNINLLSANTAALSLYYNDGTNVPATTDSLTLTIDTGKIVKFMGNGCLHAASGSTPYRAGKYVYHINGTLDMSASTATSYVAPDSVTASSVVYLNVNGLLKLGKGLSGVNNASSGHDGKVVFNINNGGLVDATITTALNLGTNYFIINGTGALKRKVGNSTVGFPVGTVKGVGAVGLVNSKAVNNFWVSVQDTFTHPIDTTKVVKKQWSISTDGHGSEVNVSLSWTKTQQGSGFDTQHISMINYDGVWKETFAGIIAGNGTVANPDTAKNNETYTQFGVFGLQTGNLPPNTAPTESQLKADFKSHTHNQHPRLFVDSASFSAFMAKIDSNATLQNIRSRILTAAHKIMTDSGILSPVHYNLTKARAALTRIWTLAQAYKFTGDTTYAGRVGSELYAIDNYPTWRDSTSTTTFDLAMSEMLTAVAFGYDWCYQYFTTMQRSAIKSAMIAKGLSAGLTSYTYPAQTSSSWVTGIGDNWNLVCNSGLTIGALALADTVDANGYGDAWKILSNGLKYVQFSLGALSDGSWPEGITYWRYGMDYYAKYITCLHSALGSDYGRCDTSIKKTGYFPIDEYGAVGFNFKDASATTDNNKLLFMFFANRFNDPVLANYRFAQIKNPHDSLGAFEDLVWFKSSITDTSAVYSTPENYLNTTSLSKDKNYENVGAITMRKDWSHQGYFAGFKNGKVNTNHTHLDAGSFVYDALGVRWANDLGPDDYGLPNYRFDVYKTRAESHNTIVINPDIGPDQDIAATATAVLHPGTDASYAITDLKDVYAYKGATKMQRGINLMHGKRSLLVQDEITLATPSDVYWSLLLPFGSSDTVLTGGRAAYLRRSGKKVKVILVKPAGAVFVKTLSDKFSSSPVEPKQNTNPTTPKLSIYLTGFSKDTIAVYFVPYDGVNDTIPPAIVPMSTWQTSDTVVTHALKQSPLKLYNSNGKVDLLWNAANTTQSSFIAQRSTGNMFVNIGQAQANSFGDVTFTDEKPILNTVSYYRIQQVDKTNRATFSDTQSIELKASQDDGLILYPNPVSSAVTLKLKTNNTNLRLVMADLSGRAVLNISGTLDYISRQLNLKLNSLPSGLYMFKLTDNGKSYSRKMIKE